MTTDTATKMTAAELDKSRAEFEAWYAKRHPQPVHDNPTWAHASKCDDWEVWQAAMIAQARAAAPAKDTPESMANSNARFAIDGAIQYGRENRNPPPSDDHWLAEYWSIGRQLAKLGEPGWDNVTPFAAPAPQAAAAEQTKLDVREMVNRFLGWKLPQDFHPDAGISFDRSYAERWGMPSGTNLLHAGQAKEMFEHCLKDAALSQQPAQAAGDERGLFEHHERASNLSRDPSIGDYLNPCVQSAWEGWQARAALAARAEAEPVAPAILEALSWHSGERDDLTLEEAVEAIRNGWKKVRGRAERAMLLQLASLMAGTPVAQQAAPVATEWQKDIDGIADELEAEALNYEGDFADTVKGCADALRQIADRAAPVSERAEDARDAGRWRFMMRVVDNENGPEFQAMEAVADDFEDGRPKSVQFCEMADAAMAATNAPKEGAKNA